MPKALWQYMHPKACYTLYYYYVSVKVRLYNMTHINIPLDNQQVTHNEPGNTEKKPRPSTKNPNRKNSHYMDLS